MSNITDRLNGMLDTNVTSGHLDQSEVQLLEATLMYIKDLEATIKICVDKEI